MSEPNSRRHNQRIDLNPPEVGILLLEDAGHVYGTTLVPSPRKLFIDMMNRSQEGVGIQTEKEIEPETTFYLQAFNRDRKSWELFKGQTKWLLKDREKGIYYKVGAELKSAQVANGLFREKDHHHKKMPGASDYQFFRKTDLLKSISRDSVCSLLNCITFKHVKAGERFITQGGSGDACFIIQQGICVVNVEKDGEMLPVVRKQAGDVVGEMALITGEPRSAHVDAEADMHLWCLKKAHFDKISQTHPELRSFLTDLIANWFETRPITAERRIGKYVITDIIGKGGYSIVYRGVHEVLGMPVAVKMMKHDMAMRSDFIQNFKNEAKTIAKFNHENIVNVYDFEERFQTLFIVMEHLEGMSLRSLLKRMLKLPPIWVVDYLLQICAGLQYSHTKNVVHQDIKPGNIFILPNDKIKILDFGLACPSGAEQSFDGTPFYMSPEQIDCLPVDVRTDIYSLGLMAYEMLTGQRPFPEKDAWEVMDLRLKHDIPDPAEIVPDLPEALRNFILKACARDINQRYPNMDQAIGVLRPLVQDSRLPKNDLTIEKKKNFSLLLTYSDKNQSALKRLVEVFKANAQALGADVKITDN
jgi:tRNA A-37 threonylcarbamoyl transferase component Bud32